MNKSPLHIAIVILNWNGKSLLQQFLPSVIKTNYPNYTIVVADNGSTDDSIEFIENEYPNIDLIKLDKNHGFAGGYNQALKQVKADIFVLLNSDVEVTPNWLNPIAKAFEQDPKLGAAQPKIRWQRNKAMFEYAGGSGGFMDRFGYTFCRGRIFNELEKDDCQYNDEQEIFWATGCALFIRADLYHNLGGLDADFFAHMEEIDLCWRLKNCGYSIKVIPNSMVYHVGAATLQKSNPRKTFLNFRNNLAMLFKNLPTSKLFHIILIRLILDGVAGLKFLLSGDIKSVWAIIKAHFAFYAWLPNLSKKRKKIKKINQSFSIGEANRTGIYKGSLVWQHFAKGVKKFSQLKW